MDDPIRENGSVEAASLGAMVAALVPADGAWQVSVPALWMQGRTLYGGLTAALALATVQRAWGDLPPLRSAQIAFVGPAAGEIAIRPTLLRRGRTAAFVEVELGSALGLGLKAMFVFMAPQDSHVDLPPQDLAAVPPLGDAIVPPEAVLFPRNFELRRTGTGIAGKAALMRWARLRVRDRLDPLVELLAIGDILPPAAMKLFSRSGPISSMSWQLNLLDPAPATTDGWWLVEAVADCARDGSSSQQMRIWSGDGRQVASAMQSIALFA